MSYADKLGFPFVVLIGEDEIAQGKVALKNMATGEQILVTPEAASETVRGALAERAAGAVIIDS